MENIILGQEMTLPYIVNVTDMFSFPVKKIKMKDTSKNNMDRVIMNSRNSRSQIQSTEVNDSNISVSSKEKSDPVESTLLENIEKLDIVNYTNQLLYVFNSKPIRLTDAMYVKVSDAAFVEGFSNMVENNSLNDLVQGEGSTLESINSESAELNTDVSTIVDSVNVSQVQNAVEDAFNSTPDVKKVGYADVKARVDKFNNSVDLQHVPKVGHINDSIFSSPVQESKESINSVAESDNSNNREVPVVTPERSESEIKVSNFQNDSHQRFVFDSENENNQDNKSSDDLKDENNYLDELKQYEKSFKEKGNGDFVIPTDIISFEEAKENIEKARELSRSLDAQARAEREKLQKAMDKCSEELEGYRTVCEQVKTYIVSYQEANKEKEEQIDDLVAKRQEQEAKAATYAHQRQEIASLMSSQDNAYTDQSVHIKRMSA